MLVLTFQQQLLTLAERFSQKARDYAERVLAIFQRLETMMASHRSVSWNSDNRPENHSVVSTPFNTSESMLQAEILLGGSTLQSKEDSQVNTYFYKALTLDNRTSSQQGLTSHPPSRA